MKPFFLFISINLFLVLNISFAQEYNTVKKRFTLHPEKSNLTYLVGSTFEYNFSITKNGDNYKVYLDEHNSSKYYVTDSVRPLGSRKIDCLKLKVENRGLFKRTNFFESQITYECILDDPYPVPLIHETGLVENVDNCWLHPPRCNFFRVLELAPYPYIKKNIGVGGSWKDKILIGNQWSDSNWAEWEGKLLLHLSYEIISIQKEKTKFGELQVINVEGISSSEIGMSTMNMKYNESYGVLSLEYNILGVYIVSIILNKRILG